ncbi:MAG: hypothetical protein AVDCRST_MAG88-951, partial [uncultured Thermomicrobiales bacterium]
CSTTSGRRPSSASTAASPRGRSPPTRFRLSASSASGHGGGSSCATRGSRRSTTCTTSGRT